MELELLSDDSQPGDSPGLRYVRGEITAEQYWREKLPQNCFDWQCGGYPECGRRLRAALDWGFWSLHALDRADPFWHGTNGLATLHKLEEFASRLIERGENAVEGAWLRIAVGLVFGSDYLNLEAWKILLDEGEFNPDWIVKIAMNTEVPGGEEVAFYLGDLVRSMQVEALVVPRIRELAARGEAEAEWATIALEHIGAK